MKNCLVTTEEIENLKEHFDDETIASIKGLISAWQNDNNKNIDEYPTVEELKTFMQKKRGEGANKPLSEKVKIAPLSNKDLELDNIDFRVRLIDIEEYLLTMIELGNIDVNEALANLKDIFAKDFVFTEEQYPRKHKMLQKQLARTTQKLEEIKEAQKTQKWQESLQRMAATLDWLNTHIGTNPEDKAEIRDSIVLAQKGITYEDCLKHVVPFFTDDELDLIKQAIPNMKTSKKIGDKVVEIAGKFKIVSVTRTTDPVFFSQEIVKALKVNSLKPLNDPTRINAIEIITKHDGKPLQDILDACEKYRVAPMISFSISSMGGSFMEPGAMKADDMLDHLQQLIDKNYIDPATTTIRLDPIMPGVTDMDKLIEVAERAFNMGFRKFVTSLMQSYGYSYGREGDRKTIQGVREAFRKLSEEDKKKYGATPSGDYDWAKYYGIYLREDGEYVPRSHAKDEYREQIGRRLLEFIQKHETEGIKFETCSFTIPGIKPSACLDPYIIQRVVGVDVTNKDGSVPEDETRKECRCYGAHSDMFQFGEKTCRTACGYCYAAQSDTPPIEYYNEDGSLKDIPETQIYENPKKSYRPQTVVDDTDYTPKQVTPKKIDIDYDPITRNKRARLVAHLFSWALDGAIEKEIAKLDQRIAATENEEERIQLIKQKQYMKSDRLRALSIYTPTRLFEQLKNTFANYEHWSEEKKLNDIYEDYVYSVYAEHHTPEENLRYAKAMIAHRTREYKKIAENFEQLVEDAAPHLAVLEGVKITTNSNSIAGVSMLEDSEGGVSKEESPKEGWQVYYREVSSEESLSQETRRALGSCIKFDYANRPIYDDLGFPEYIDANYAHVTLIKELSKMVTEEDMMPLLMKLYEKKRWLGEIIEKLQNDEQLYSKFYRDFRKDNINYSIQKTKMTSDGPVIQIINANEPEDQKAYFNLWRDNLASGAQLSEHSVYDNNGNFILSNAEYGYNLVKQMQEQRGKELQAKHNKQPVAVEMPFTEEHLKNIHDLLNMIGAEVDIDILRHSIQSEPEDVNAAAPFDRILIELESFFKTLSKDIKSGWIKEQQTHDIGNYYDLLSEKTKGHLYNFYYRNIVKQINYVNEEAIEDTAVETIDNRPKSFYGHIKPNFMTTLLKQLRDGNKERLAKFLEQEYKQYAWFYDKEKGEWRNKLLYTIDEENGFLKTKNLLQHKQVLSHNGVSFGRWDALDYMLTMLGEYQADESGSTAFFYVPVMADASVAEFIRLERRDFNIFCSTYDNREEYKDSEIVDQLVDIVLQEYDRIMTVRRRNELYEAGDPSIVLEQNYDMAASKDGLGGSIFKFLPAFNELVDRKDKNGNIIKDKNGNPEKILSPVLADKLGEMFNTQSMTMDEIRDFLKDQVVDMMESEFEKEIQYYESIGLFETDKDTGQLKHLKHKDKQSAISLLLRDYFYNSTLATAHIYQLSITDLAYYSDEVDTQKRYKCVHSPHEKLNTRATINGVRVGTENEHAVYIKDQIVASDIIDEVKRILQQKVDDGIISTLERDFIISKFEEVNVTDAQAYRGLRSMRKVLAMAGEWDKNVHEVAYQNIKNGKWSLEDFNIVLGAIKPFAYGTMGKNTGVNGERMKVPVIHKNSEVCLMAMYELVAGPLKQSPKLRALSEFLEDENNDIDVIMFDSAVKTGKQGVVDINNLNDVNEIKNTLAKQCFTHDAKGNRTGINDNVVHTMSFENYGIQTETPEHSTDVAITIGKQIVKIVAANLPKNLNVNGKNMSDKEWMDLYNALHVENILQSYLETEALFESEKTLSQILVEEIKGNPRYGMEILKAVTLNEDGLFNMPLGNPTLNKLAPILHSIINSRIRDQKFKGGTLVQVSAYGLTDQLSVVFKNKDGEVITYENYAAEVGDKASKEGFEAWKKEKYEKGDLAVAYFECFMPAYSEKMFTPFMKEGTHELDINKLPEELRKLIGYRVPTEAKYSMAPLYIKGFLPQQMGSAIMLPKEITTISGSDFDRNQC